MDLYTYCDAVGPSSFCSGVSYWLASLAKKGPAGLKNFCAKKIWEVLSVFTESRIGLFDP